MNQKLLEFAIRQEPKFITTTHGGKQNLQHRNSLVLGISPEDIQRLSRYIREGLPSVLKQLQMAEFPVGNIEAQITAHGDGHYYKIHQDNGTPDLALRQLTYVYYFYREPKQFSGGELKIYDDQVEDDRSVKADSFHIIEPRNNSIVFFPSHYLHEVLPVSCSSPSFADSRFTLNGWVRRE